MKDARVAVRKVKPDGLLIFDDYTGRSPMEAIPYGVVAVVNELVAEGCNVVGLALTPTGYFDIALAR